MAILDADKKGFLRSTRSLIQTIGRAARHVRGKAILYADVLTDSMKRAIVKLIASNQAVQLQQEISHTPRDSKSVRDMIDGVHAGGGNGAKGPSTRNRAPIPPEGFDQPASATEMAKCLRHWESKKFKHAEGLEFELAASVRDQITAFKSTQWGMSGER
ncbi:MAG: hypothetical protein Ct9H300mP13_6760 [Gammaproteobacteria bacterium]|nr:MAG: hypothetical protein Ct9H300mP13_6760 [Gammaproteobacteria bacterium]